jgi:hypothetical protein
MRTPVLVSLLAPSEDRATIYFTVVGGNPNDPDPAKRPGLVFRDGEGPPVQRVYQHPGGMQLIGKMLALAVERPREFPFEFCNIAPDLEICQYDRAPDRTQIMFFDVSDPEAPVFKSQYTPINGDGAVRESAGSVAITPIPGDRYLMMTTGGDNTTWFFYRSTIGDLSSPSLSWDFLGSNPGPDVQDAHQTLQFLRQGNIDGPLYLAGARSRFASDDRDRVDLYHIQCAQPTCEAGEEIAMSVVWNGQRITPFPSAGGNRLANLAAATGFHVTPSGELLFYATEHDNDGPDGTVKAGEWRHEDMVREGSPTLLPTAVVNGPYEVDEGSSVSLSGSAKPPITKAFIQLFHQTDFRTFYPVVDFDDRDLDDFDDFFTLEFQLVVPGGLFTHNDKARSWKWFAPVGCSMKAIDHVGSVVDEEKTLAGIGSVQSDADLKLVLNDGGTDDIDQEIDAVEFLDDCVQYYATPFNLQWDLDRNGSYETTGTTVNFDAALVDGPSLVAIPVQAQHPSGGAAGETTTTVNVHNVAPQLTSLRLTDAAGHEVNVEVPFILTGQQITLSTGFTDPGVLDHQTAMLAWGDGAVDLQTAFTMFDEAFGDATGAASQTHRYALPGTYAPGLSVSDDDGGTGTGSAVVRVLTPEQAVEEILDLLDDVIAGTTDARVLKDLEKARRALAGNPNGNNGALDKIRDGNTQAAIAHLRQAIDRLRQAEAQGADVGALIALLEQVIAALPA